jgi:hypothetical protein
VCYHVVLFEKYFGSAKRKIENVWSPWYNHEEEILTKSSWLIQ